MKVLFATPFYFPEHKFGGPPRKIHAVACGLVKRGNNVLVLTFDSEHRDNGTRCKIDGVTVQYLRWAGGGLRQFPREWHVLSDALRGVQVVHGYGLYNFLCPAVALLACRQDKPFVLEPLGMYPARLRNRLAKKLYNHIFTRWMSRRMAAAVAASEAEAHDLRQTADARKILLRRNGVDVAAFSHLPSGEGLRARWRIRDDERLVLFIGRLSPVKNLEQLILAFEQAQLHEARLVLVGPQSEAHYVETLRVLIAARQLDGRVVLAGPLYDDEQRAALGAADLFVLPSLSESFGNAAAEAVAAGIPVLLTDTCGVAPMIHGRAGLAVPLGVESIASGLQELLGDDNRCSELTAQRVEVVRELDWDAPIRQTEDLYIRLLRGEPVVPSP